METGINNFRYTDFYRQFQGQTYLTSNQLPYFNGNTTTIQIENPWKEFVELRGSEVMSEAINDSENIYDLK